MTAQDLFLLVQSDTVFVEISLLQYRSLLLDSPALAIPALASRRVRFAHLCAVPATQPALIARSYYRYLTFQANGTVDRAAFFSPLFEDFARLQHACRAPATPSMSNVVSAQHRFELSYTSWVPSSACLTALRAVALAQTKPQSLDELLKADFVDTGSP